MMKMPHEFTSCTECAKKLLSGVCEGCLRNQEAIEFWKGELDRESARRKRAEAVINGFIDGVKKATNQFLKGCDDE
jgi:predicted Fe-S protein YdhL (DUF1289 family)